jgi:tRNA-splicing ligase RtcB
LRPRAGTDHDLLAHDALSNCRLYPKDAAPVAYKNFDSVLESVKVAAWRAKWRV